MSKSIDNISIASHENIEMDGIQKLGITLGLLGLFIMTLALFNVSFPNKGFWLAGSIVSIFTGIVVYANRTYLNKPAGIKQRCVAQGLH
jgi:FtsH-binding integral membrane protein